MQANPVGYLVAAASIFLASTSIALELTRPLVDKTVPAGATAQFQPTYRSDLPVTFVWQHEGKLLKGQTNSSLTISNAEPKNVGNYTVVLTSGGTQIVSSAILDLDVAYPAAAFADATPTRFPTAMLLSVAGTFPNGTVCGLRNQSTYLEGWYASVTGFDPTTGSNKWTVLNEIQNVGGTTYRACTTDDGKCIVGRPWFQMGSGPSASFSVVTSDGQIGGGFGFGNYVDSFFLDSQQNIHFRSSYVSNTFRITAGGQTYSETRTGVGIAAIADRNSHMILSYVLPFGYAAVGRLFYANRANSVTLPGVPSGNPTNWVFGALTSAGNVGWVAETPLLPFQVPIPDASDGRSGFTALANDGLERISSTGEILWKVPISLRRPEDVHITALGHSQIFSVVPYALKVGSFALPENNDAPFVFIDIDRAGVVRMATRLNCTGVDRYYETDETRLIPAREFALVSPGRYRTTIMMKTNAMINNTSYLSTSNRLFIAQMNVPEPDVSMPAVPESTVTVTNTGSVTLNASPEVPGAVVYQWFHDDQAVVNGATHDLTISNFSFAQAGRYSVRLRNAYGTALKAIARVNYAGPVALSVDVVTRDGTVLVRWPTNSLAFRLEQTSDLLQPFAPASGDVTTNAALARCEMRFNSGATPTFYRLATK